MATVEKTSLKRVFAGRHFLKGERRIALIWSALAAIVFCLILLTLLLLIDLLHTQGHLQLSPEQEAEFVKLVPKFSSSANVAKAPGEEPPAKGEPAEDSDDAIDADDPEAAPPADDEAVDLSAISVDEKSEEQLRLESRQAELRLNFESRGILPSVWWLRDSLWRYPIARLYENIPALQSTTTALVTLIITLVCWGLLFNLLISRVSATSARIGMEVAQKLRRDLHRQVLRLGPGDLCEDRQQYAIQLFTEDSETVRTSAEALSYRYSRDPVLLIALVLFSLSLNWLLALQCLIPLGACWYLIRQEIVRFRESRRILHGSAESTLKILSNSFRNTRLVRAYSMEQVEQENFGKNLERLKARLLSVNQRERWSRWFCRALIVFCTSIVLILVCMKILIDETNLSLAAGLTLLITFLALHWPLKRLSEVPAEKSNAAQATARIYRYLDRVPPVSQAVGAKFLSPLSKSLTYEAVHYQTETNEKLLAGLDLTITAGESVALVSLNRLECVAAAYLVPRFIEPNNGRVLIDGEDTAWATLESLRTEIAYVGANDQFFTGSVLENIRSGDNSFSHSAVTEAAKLARAHNFILRLPNGYETILGQHGETLNAGQGFRLGIARALLRNPALLILAEPTETLDNDTKSRLDDAYTQILNGRTTIFLPTRLSTVRRVNRIILLHEGKVEAIGTHAELVKNSPIYRHWEYMNFNAFRSAPGNGET